MSKMPFLSQFLTAVILFSWIDYIHNRWMHFLIWIGTCSFHCLSNWSTWTSNKPKKMAMPSCACCFHTSVTHMVIFFFLNKCMHWLKKCIQRPLMWSTIRSFHRLSDLSVETACISHFSYTDDDISVYVKSWKYEMHSAVINLLSRAKKDKCCPN